MEGEEVEEVAMVEREVVEDASSSSSSSARAFGSLHDDRGWA